MLAMGLPVRRVLSFAFAHAVVTLCLLVYAFSVGMSEFDRPDLPGSATAKAAGTVAGVLMLPGRLVWTTWASKNLSNTLEWITFLANSVIWGALIVGVTVMFQAGSRKRIVS
jgi:hypothetical protein